MLADSSSIKHSMMCYFSVVKCSMLLCRNINQRITANLLFWADANKCCWDKSFIYRLNGLVTTFSKDDIYKYFETHQVNQMMV